MCSGIYFIIIWILRAISRFDFVFIHKIFINIHEKVCRTDTIYHFRKRGLVKFQPEDDFTFETAIHV